MKLPRLMAITTARAGAERDAIWRLLSRATPRSIVVQLRDRDCAARELAERGRALRDITRHHSQLFIVGDRLDVALTLGADGAHLPESGVSATDARQLLGHAAWLSRACHPEPSGPLSLPPGELAQLDALVVSPALAARKGRAALGLERLEAVARSVASMPSAPAVFALGGVDGTNAAACVAAGAAGVAAIGAAHDGAIQDELLAALGVLRSFVTV